MRRIVFWTGLLVVLVAARHVHADEIPKASKGYRPARPTWRRR